MLDTGCVVVLVTASSNEEAQKIADRLLSERKAACVSIVAGVSSLFRWQNNIDSAQEHLMIIKTRNALLSEVVSLVKELHSYTIPEIIALPVVGGNPAYLEWIDKETC